MPRIITSPADRVKTTIAEAYASSTGESASQSEVTQYTNAKSETLQKTQKNVYNNLLGLGGPRSNIEPEFQSALQQLEEDPNNNNLSELALQDKACLLFLQGRFDGGNPYTVSKQRLQLLLKGFDKLDTQDEVKIIAMRHGHRDGNNLTPLGIQEAKDAGQQFDFGSQDIVIGTHQTIIESILISLVGGSQSLTAQDARDVLPSQRQEPYKTAQVTEFIFSKDKDGEKILSITTNNHTEIFTEQQCRNTYNYIRNL